jgi:hypothetical protein
VTMLCVTKLCGGGGGGGGGGGREEERTGYRNKDKNPHKDVGEKIFPWGPCNSLETKPNISVVFAGTSRP